MKIKDDEILRALIHQVMKAANGKSEQEVVTYITRPMWRAFCRATGTPTTATPTGWAGSATVRVFGSRTIVVPSTKLESISFCAHVQSPKRRITR